MSGQDNVVGISNIAREISKKDTSEFAIILTDSQRTSNILSDLLERAFKIPKNRITKIGPTSTGLQDAINLARKRDIVIAPEAIVLNYATTFNPPVDIKRIVLYQLHEEKVSVSKYENEGKPFTLKLER